MTGFNFVCTLCNNAYSKVQAFRSSEIENFHYYGLVPLKIGKGGKYSADMSTIFPVIVMACKHCGHLALFHANLFEEALKSGE